MKYNPDIHHRRSIRLKEFDYTQNEAYFITICSWQRNPLFDEIIDKNMKFSTFGEAVEETWLDLPNHRRYRARSVRYHARPFPWNYHDFTSSCGLRKPGCAI